MDDKLAMVELVFALFLCVLTHLVLAGGWRTDARHLNLRPRGEAWVMGALSIAAAIYFFGPLAGIALCIVVAVHEYGHVAAYRVAGHPDATFRLIPLLGGVAISRRRPKTQLHEFYITFMGPGICFALMAIALALAGLVEPSSAVAADMLWMLATVAGALNFFNLLPLWPLDGGRLTRILVSTVSPTLAHYLTLAMSAALAVLAVASHSLLFMLFAIISAHSALNAPRADNLRQRLTIWQALIGLMAYAAALAAFFIGGEPIINRYL